MKLAKRNSRLALAVNVAVVHLCLVQSARPAEDADAIELLQLKEAAVVGTSVRLTPEVGALTDGDTGKAVSFTTAKNAPLQVVFAFGKESVSPEKLIVYWAPTKEASEPPTIEVLASSLSPHTGFQTLRTARLQPQNGPQEFAFVPTGAKWILFRISASVGAENWSLAEISLLGHQGPPATRYAFNESPAKAFDVLAKLKEMISVKLSPDEASMFADAQDGQLDRWSFAEAALIASGVTQRDERRAMLRKIDAYESAANQAVGRGKNPLERGERLLKYLHSKPLAAGYVAQQTDLSTLLETGHYNCVSSATIYNILGRRIGLDVRAVEVPDHAFSILYHGSQHADVEVTTVQGFKPSRDPKALETFRQQTGFRYIPDRHPEQRREIRETGLISIIYYNHGVMHSEQKEYGEALLRYFCALSLDPEFDSAVKNVLATLANWGVDLSNQEQFEPALKVVNVGLTLAPKDATLLNNRKAIWHARVNGAIDAGETVTALSLLREAHLQVPDGNFPAMQSWVFLRPAEDLVNELRWEDALQLARSGMKKVDDAAKRELQEWSQGLFLRWSNQLMKQKQFDIALDGLQKGLERWPDDRSLKGNMAYVAQEWTQDVLKEKSAEEAEAVLSGLLKKYPEMQSIGEVAHSYAVRLVNGLVQKHDFEQALAAIGRCQKFLLAEDVLRLSQSVYDAWANDYQRKQAWDEALAIYAAALERFPEDPHLSNNAKATWSLWIQSHVTSRQWKQAVDVCAKAMNAQPESAFDGNLGYVAQEWLAEVEGGGRSTEVDKVAGDLLKRFSSVTSVQMATVSHYARTADQLAGQQKYEQALSVLDRGEKLLKTKDTNPLLSAGRRVYDRRAGQHLANKQWQKAVDVYASGLKRYPGDSHLKNNALATWGQWAGTYIDEQQWDAAIEVFDKALKQFPDSGTLKNNREFCEQQRDRSN